MERVHSLKGHVSVPTRKSKSVYFFIIIFESQHVKPDMLGLF